MTDLDRFEATVKRLARSLVAPPGRVTLGETYDPPLKCGANASAIWTTRRHSAAPTRYGRSHDPAAAHPHRSLDARRPEELPTMNTHPHKDKTPWVHPRVRPPRVGDKVTVYGYPDEVLILVALRGGVAFLRREGDDTSEARQEPACRVRRAGG